MSFFVPQFKKDCAAGKCKGRDPCSAKAAPLKLTVFFDDLKFQIVKGNFFDKAVLVKSCFCMAAEITDVGFQPDRLAEIEFPADFVKRVKDLFGS